MVEVAHLFSKFLAVESCGQCPSCKLGSAAITESLAHIEAGTATDGTNDSLVGWIPKVTDGNRCFLAVEEQRSEEHTSELKSLMRISYAVFCLQKKNTPP